MFCPSFKVPLCKRPTAIRPTNVEKSKEVINICVFPSSIFLGGKYSKIRSNKGAIESVGFFQSSDIQPFFAEP